MSRLCVRFSRFNKFKSKNVNTCRLILKNKSGLKGSQRWTVLTRTRHSGASYRMQTNPEA